MATRAPFLKTRYGAYLHRDLPEEDAELTHVGPGTPCGEYMRRFWQPICFSDELKDLPYRVKILGEELVVFRDLSGLSVCWNCTPHRGASLEYGLIDARGIRCCYPGWLFAADGSILETPGEPAHSTLNGSFYFKKTHVIDPTKRISAGRAVLLATAWSDRRRAGRRLEPGSGSGWQPR